MEARKAAFTGDVLQSVESLLTTSKDSFYLDAHRSDTVQQMDHHWKYSGTVLLCGDPGVGKSALVKKAQDMLPDDVVSLYIDGKVLTSADEILSYILDALGLSGGPMKTRREAAEKLLQHAELEADLGRYVLLYLDHFDALRDNSQRFFWQLSQLPHSQLKMVVVTDSYYRECLEGFDVAETVPQLFLQPLHPHKIIHHLNERLAPSGLEMHQLLSVTALDNLIASSKGNIAQLEDALQQLIAQHHQPTAPKTRLSSTVVAVMALSMILTGGIYFVLVGDDEPSIVETIVEAAPSLQPEVPVVDDTMPQNNDAEEEDEVIEPLVEVQEVAAVEMPEPVIEAASAVVDTQPIEPFKASNEPIEAPNEPIAAPILPVTIQLMGVYERSRLQVILNKHLDQPLDIVQTERNGRPWYVLLYGSYPDKATAQRELPRIPADLKPGEPWIRMRADIR